MADCGINVEEERQINGLVWVDELVFETEALNLIEIEGRFLGIDLVNGDASYWSVGTIIDFVESKSTLARINNNRRCRRLKLPWNLILHVGHEGHSELSVDVNFAIFEFVLFGMLTHGEPECLANYVVKWMCQEVPAKQKENNSINSIEFAPLSLFTENLIDLSGLATFPDLQGEALVIRLIYRVQCFLTFIISVDIS